MWKRDSMPIWRFGVVVIFFLIGSLGLYMGINQWMTEPSLSWVQPLRDQTIILDAGHGGVDPGAVAESGILEKDITLAVSFKLRDLLQQAGATVILLREEDQDLANESTKGYSRRKNEDLRERATLIRESDASIFISLHCNAISSPKWTGAQTFYNGVNEENKVLATKIQDGLGEVMGMGRTIRKNNEIYILKRAEKPGALVELGFLSNPEEAEKLKREDHQALLALSVYKGILAYYAEK